MSFIFDNYFFISNKYKFISNKYKVQVAYALNRVYM